MTAGLLFLLLAYRRVAAASPLPDQSTVAVRAAQDALIVDILVCSLMTA